MNPIGEFFESMWHGIGGPKAGRWVARPSKVVGVAGVVAASLVVPAKVSVSTPTAIFTSFQQPAAPAPTRVGLPSAAALDAAWDEALKQLERDGHDVSALLQQAERNVSERRNVDEPQTVPEDLRIFG